MRVLWVLFILALDFMAMAQIQTQIHGHRGTRGYLPENTVPSFIKAFELGAHAIELDVVITKDGYVLVSHEPYMSAGICLDKLGNSLNNPAKNHNIYEMTVDQTREYDCGSLPHGKFKQQERMRVHKPLLSEVVEAVENYLEGKKGGGIIYNIEIKSDPKGDGIQHPAPKEYVKLVHDELKRLNILDKSFVQSFDVRILQELKQLDPMLPISYLVANLNSWEKNIEELGFIPDYYTPYYKLLKKKKVKAIQALNIKVGTWTVNKEKDIKKLVRWGVDVIITDYPDRGANVLKTH